MDIVICPFSLLFNSVYRVRYFQAITDQLTTQNPLESKVLPPLSFILVCVWSTRAGMIFDGMNAFFLFLPRRPSDQTCCDANALRNSSSLPLSLLFLLLFPLWNLVCKLRIRKLPNDFFPLPCDAFPHFPPTNRQC